MGQVTSILAPPVPWSSGEPPRQLSQEEKKRKAAADRWSRKQEEAEKLDAATSGKSSPLRPEPDPLAEPFMLKGGRQKKHRSRKRRHRSKAKNQKKKKRTRRRRQN